MIIILAPSKRWLVTLALLSAQAAAAAQGLPDGPVSAFNGRLTASGDVVATAGRRDTDTFFNYTDYEHDALRLLRISLAGAWRPIDRLAFAVEARSEDLEEPAITAAYVRVRPWSGHALDFQAGRIPPVFGAFGRRAYSADNPFIGYPLSYQYLTSLRTDAVPATAGDLLNMRGRGWRSSFPVGSQEPAPGVPLVSAFRWDTGIQARWIIGRVTTTAAATNGTLSNPRVSDDNGGKQLSGRIAVTPVVGLILGASGARGRWLARSVSDGNLAQTTWGVDAEYSRGYWLVRTEAVVARWDLPYSAATSNGRDVRAWGWWVEGRYRLTPRVFVAARADHLGFSRIAAAGPRAALPWDAPVDRLEAVAGYYLQRNLVGRLGLQANWRDDGRGTRKTFASAQVAWWF